MLHLSWDFKQVEEDVFTEYMFKMDSLEHRGKQKKVKHKAHVTSQLGKNY